MKSLVVLALLVSSQAFAVSLAPLECSNGKIGEDSYVAVSMFNGAVDFQRHEEFIKADSSETITSGNTTAVLNKKMTVTAEGDESTSIINALLVYDTLAKTLNVTLIKDGYAAIAAQTLSCN